MISRQWILNLLPLSKRHTTVTCPIPWESLPHGQIEGGEARLVPKINVEMWKVGKVGRKSEDRKRREPAPPNKGGEINTHSLISFPRTHRLPSSSSSASSSLPSHLHLQSPSLSSSPPSVGHSIKQLSTSKVQHPQLNLSISSPTSLSLLPSLKKERNQ